MGISRDQKISLSSGGEVNAVSPFTYIQTTVPNNYLPANFRAYTSGTGSGATFQLWGNATLGGTPNYQNVSSNENLVSEVDVAGTTLSGGTLLASYVVSNGASLIVDLESLRLRMPPTLTLTIAAKVNSGSAADTGASIVWYEDV